MKRTRTKEELIGLLIPAIIEHSGEPRDIARARLQTVDTAELEHMLMKQKKAGHLSEETIEHRQALIAAIIDLDSTADSDALAQQATEELETTLLGLYKAEMARMEEEHDVAIIEERAARVAESIWFAQKEKERLEADHERRMIAFEAQDREVFSAAAKESRGFSITEAGFRLVREALGPCLSVTKVAQWVAAHPGALSPASPEEIEQWRHEETVAYKKFLRDDADLLTLRRLTREAGARAGQAPPEGDPDATARQRDQILGRTAPLPRDITYDMIFKASPETLKNWIRRFGVAALNERLREGARAEQALNKL